MPESNRQLAAIVFTDIVGYTALMGSDEPKALSILRKSREIQKSAIEAYNGKWLKEMGDGVLAQFSSAVDAVQCALKIQQRANAELEAKIRIGIHLGDVTIENEDIFGDGVNIASRLQAITDPGGIYISGSIHEAVHAYPEIKYRFLAVVNLKNVDHPIETYCLVEEWLPEPTARKIREISEIGTRKIYYLASFVIIMVLTALGWWFNHREEGKIRSIAVLPVNNFSGDSSKNIMMAGIHTLLRDEIAKIGDLRVISSRSTRKYKNTDMTIVEIAEELNVEAVIEPDIFDYGENVNIQVRFIKAIPDEKQIWSQSFIGMASDVLSIYDSIALIVADKSGIILGTDELSKFRRVQKVDPESQEAYLKGMGYLYKGDKQSLNKALELFEYSVEKDPEFARGYLGLTLVWGFKTQMKYVSSIKARPNIEKYLFYATKLDSTITDTHYVLAVQNTWTFFNWEKAEKEFRRTIEQDPAHAEARAYYAHFLVFMHRLEEAAEQMEKARELEPYNNWVDQLYAMYLNNTRQFEKARIIALKSLEEESGPVAAAALWTNYHNTGDYEEAFKAAREVLLERREYETVGKLTGGYQEGGYKLAMEWVAEASELKRDTSDFSSWRLATLYVRANNQEKALDWLEKAYEERDQGMPYLSCDPIFDNIETHPRFQALLTKLGLTRTPQLEM